MARNVLDDRMIGEILGDGQDSDLSDFSDESDFTEVFNTDELDNILAINEFFEPFEDDNFEVDQNIDIQDNTALDAQNNEVDLEILTLPVTHHSVRKENIKWEAKPLTTKDIIFNALEKTNFPSTPQPPIDYFFKYFPNNSFEDMAYFTNIFAKQNNTQN